MKKYEDFGLSGTELWIEPVGELKPPEKPKPYERRWELSGINPGCGGNWHARYLDYPRDMPVYVGVLGDVLKSVGDQQRMPAEDSDKFIDNLWGNGR